MNLNSPAIPEACERVLLRQFDDDCRHGLVTPADVAAHLATCASCREEWQQRDAFDQQLRTALQADVPVEVYRRAYHAAVTETSGPSPALRKMFRLLFAGLVGTSSLLLTLMVPFLQQWSWLAPVAFVTTAALTYLVEFAQEDKTPAL